MGMGLEVDNMALGAIAAPIDISSGVIVGEAFRSVGSGQNKTYSQHPQTKVQITGFEIPYWDEVIRLVYDLCEHVPGDKYVGWDVAIGPAGPIVIEGNFGWSMIPFQVFNDRGMLEELLPYFDNRCLYPVQKKYV